MSNHINLSKQNKLIKTNQLSQIEKFNKCEAVNNFV